jgi:hypothetical protein
VLWHWRCCSGANPEPIRGTLQVPERGPPRGVEVMVVEKEGWPGYQLLEEGSWTQHAAKLDVNNCRPGSLMLPTPPPLVQPLTPKPKH